MAARTTAVPTAGLPGRIVQARKSRAGEDARGIVVHDLNVRDERGAGINSFEEVMGKKGVLGHAIFEGGHERVHVVEPLAREDPLAEKVLISVRNSGGVGIDSGVAGAEAGGKRAGGGGRAAAQPGGPGA